MAYRRTAEVQARLDAQRARIVAAATHQLAEHGYAGCSIAAVAARAGVASGTVYNHFDGKAELVAEVFRDVVQPRGRRGARRGRRAEPARADRVTALVETFAGARAEVAAAGLRAARRAGRPASSTSCGWSSAWRSATSPPARSRTGVARRRAARRRTPRVVAAALVGAIGEALVGPLSGDAEPGHRPRRSSRFALRSIGVRDAVHA